MYRLFYYPANANLAPHILLEEARVPFELELVDRERGAQRDPDYLRLNPNGRIPTLVDGDLVLFEAAAICLYLVDRHPEAGLAPPPGTQGRPHFHQWLVYLTNTIQADCMALHYPEKYTRDAAGQAAVRAAAVDRLSAGFTVLEDALAGNAHLLGEDYSACDAYLYMVCGWARHMPEPPASRPRLRRLLDAVAERPAVQRACASEGIDRFRYAEAAPAEHSD